VSWTIGVDVGGTKVLGGVVDEAGTILRTARRPTPSVNVDETCDAIADVVAELRFGREIDAVGIGAAGFVDASRATILFAPNLAWRNEPLRDRVRERVGLPVVVENDANCAAWAEYRFGAGQGEQVLVLITMGTGIGGGLVIGGSLYRGAFGMGAEYGHLRVVPGGRRCGCGNRGCWEQYASGKALVREARDIAVGAPLTARRLLEIAGGTINDIEGPEITTAALEGDPAAVDCFQEVGSWLGQGIADLTAVLDPSCFVVGGGVAEAGDLLLEPARKTYAEAVSGRTYRPLASIRRAALGNTAGLVGAADLARAR